MDISEAEAGLWDQPHAVRVCLSVLILLASYKLAHT